MSGGTSARPRLLHPAAWWGWALCLGAAATRTTNPWLLALFLAVLVWVSAQRREPGGRRILLAFLLIGLAAILLRLVMVMLLGGGGFGRIVLLDLPVLPLPEWFGGLRIGGPVLLETVVATCYQGLQIATVLVAVGAANALASPRRLLRYVPATLYDVGTALVVGLTYAPLVIDDARRLARARRLRGQVRRGPREMGRLAVPVLSAALEHALALSASMESRGYGRAASGAAVQRRSSAVSVLAMVCVVIGAYGLVDGRTPLSVTIPLLLLGVAGAVGTLFVGWGRDPRTRYRRDRWTRSESLVLALGLLPLLVMIGLGVAPADALMALAGASDLTPRTVPLTVPDLPLLPVLAILGAGLAGVVSPPIPSEYPQRSSYRQDTTASRAQTPEEDQEEPAPHAMAPALVRGTARSIRGSMGALETDLLDGAPGETLRA